MMSCEIPDEELRSWMDRDAPQLKGHLAQCPQCRARAAKIRTEIHTVAAASTPPANPLPEVIGSYAIKGRLGEGGMGVVYEAEQASLHRLVALKVVRAWRYLDEQHVTMFQREARALARLKHPAIAAIYEAGRTDDGQHFFAMELVHGQPLLEYVRVQHLSIRDRLRLFCRICEAISYAHLRGVMHRDLKPSNILIDTEGNPKILDFGLARITDADVTVVTTITEVTQIIGTLAYMSPEQARGNPEEIDVRSDVYSLGVILYQLLTGELPCRISRPVLHEAVRLICEAPPRKPSTILRALRGDLETITLKALEKEPSRRYQSAIALAEDLKRHLANEPILARPPTAAYRLSKFARRHRALAGGLAAVLAALLLGVTATSIALFQAVEARQAEAAQRRIAEEVNEFLNDDLLAAVAPERLGRTATMRDVLDAASERIHDRFTGEPLVEAAIRLTLAVTYWRLGEYEAAVPHAERSLELRRARLGEEHADTLDAMNTLAILYKAMGSFDQAESLYLKALDIQQRVLGSRDTLTLNAMNSLAVLLRTQGKLDEAEALHREALAIRQDALGEEHQDTLMSMANLAVLLWEKGELDEAEVLARAALNGRERILSPDHPDTLQSKLSLAVVLAGQGELAESEQLYEETLESARLSFGDHDPRVEIILNNLGSLLTDKGDYAAAEPKFREGLELCRERLGDDDWTTADAMSNLGACLTGLGRYEEAEANLLAAHRTLATKLGEFHQRTIRTTERLGSLYEAWGKPDQAASWRAKLGADDSSRQTPSPDGNSGARP